MKALFYTNKGPVRTSNQDGVSVFGKSFTSLDAPKILETCEKITSVVVVDGMGGMCGGEEATRIVLQEIPTWTCTVCDDSHQIEKHIMLTAQKMQEIALGNEEYAKMGAVVAGLIINNDIACAFNCGDSRVYQIRSGFFQKLTHDHSAVQELCDDNLIDEDAMRSHPRKNVVTSAISADNINPKVFCKQLQLKAGNTFFICSDGIWETFSLEELETIYDNDHTIFADTLISESQKRALDNISFIILKI